jgi:MoxR-like ATPase
MGIEVANIEDYDEATASRVPPHSPGFVESPEQEIEALADAWISGEHTMLEGPKGCGKTILVAQFCFHTQLPMWRFNCSEGITEDDLVGFNTAVNGNTVWMDGIIPRWARNGGILFADEFNGASPSVMLWMHMAMDSATIVLPTGEKIDLHPSCRVVAAINPPEDYAGLEELNEATRDRYAMGLTMTYLPSNKEMTVIMDQSGNADSALAREIIALAGDLRRMKSDNTLNRDCSTRTLVQVMRLSLRQSQTRSIERALISKYDRHHREKVRTTCRARLSAFGLVE